MNESLVERLKKFQENSLEENMDQKVLKQCSVHLNNRLALKQHLLKELSVLYGRLDNCGNMQELTDILLVERDLLRSIFTLEKDWEGRQTGPDISWWKYGLDVERYLVDLGRADLVERCGYPFHD